MTASVSPSVHVEAALPVLTDSRCPCVGLGSDIEDHTRTKHVTLCGAKIPKSAQIPKEGQECPQECSHELFYITREVEKIFFFPSHNGLHLDSRPLLSCSLKCT